MYEVEAQTLLGLRTFLQVQLALKLPQERRHPKCLHFLSLMALLMSTSLTRRFFSNLIINYDLFYSSNTWRIPELLYMLGIIIYKNGLTLNTPCRWNVPESAAIPDDSDVLIAHAFWTPGAR